MKDLGEPQMISKDTKSVFGDRLKWIAYDGPTKSNLIQKIHEAVKECSPADAVYIHVLCHGKTVNAVSANLTEDAVEKFGYSEVDVLEAHMVHVAETGDAFEDMSALRKYMELSREKREARFEVLRRKADAMRKKNPKIKIPELRPPGRWSSKIGPTAWTVEMAETYRDPVNPEGKMLSFRPKEFLTLFRDMRASRAVFLLDFCFSGGFLNEVLPLLRGPFCDGDFDDEERHLRETVASWVNRLLRDRAAQVSKSGVEPHPTLYASTLGTTLARGTVLCLVLWAFGFKVDIEDAKNDCVVESRKNLKSWAETCRAKLRMATRDIFTVEDIEEKRYKKCLRSVRTFIETIDPTSNGIFDSSNEATKSDTVTDGRRAFLPHVPEVHIISTSRPHEVAGGSVSGSLVRALAARPKLPASRFGFVLRASHCLSREQRAEITDEKIFEHAQDPAKHPLPPPALPPKLSIKHSEKHVKIVTARARSSRASPFSIFEEDDLFKAARSNK